MFEFVGCVVGSGMPAEKLREPNYVADAWADSAIDGLYAPARARAYKPGMSSCRPKGLIRNKLRLWKIIVPVLPAARQQLSIVALDKVECLLQVE